MSTPGYALRQRVAGRSLDLGDRASEALSPQETDFVRRVLEGDSLDAAYVAAGVLQAEQDAVATGRRVVRMDENERTGAPNSVESILEAAIDLMGEPRVLRYFHLLQKAARSRIQVSMTPERWIGGLEAIAYADIRLLFDPAGIPIPPHRLPERMAKAVKKVTRRESPGRNGQPGEVVWIYECEDRLEAMELLARHMGLLQADKNNVADVEESRRMLIFRYVHDMHWSAGMSIAEANEKAQNDPDAVDAWARARGIGPGET